jgi:hypothetical protein
MCALENQIFSLIFLLFLRKGGREGENKIHFKKKLLIKKLQKNSKKTSKDFDF